MPTISQYDQNAEHNALAFIDGPMVAHLQAVDHGVDALADLHVGSALLLVQVAFVHALTRQLHAAGAQVAVVGAHVIDPAGHAGGVRIDGANGGLWGLRLADAAEVWGVEKAEYNGGHGALRKTTQRAYHMPPRNFRIEFSPNIMLRVNINRCYDFC